VILKEVMIILLFSQLLTCWRWPMRISNYNSYPSHDTRKTIHSTDLTSLLQVVCITNLVFGTKQFHVWITSQRLERRWTLHADGLGSDTQSRLWIGEMRVGWSQEQAVLQLCLQLLSHVSLLVICPIESFMRIYCKRAWRHLHNQDVVTAVARRVKVILIISAVIAYLHNT